MADTDTTERSGLPAIPLLATSYLFSDLLAASEHAEGLKTDDGRDRALADIPRKAAVDPEALDARDAPAIPEGTELRSVEDPQGREVEVAITIPEKEEAPAPTPSRRGASTADDTANQTDA